MAYAPTDVDIVTLQNPFNFLSRDSDIEGLSDGFDERTAYGALHARDFVTNALELELTALRSLTNRIRGWHRRPKHGLGTLRPNHSHICAELWPVLHPA